MLTPRDINPVFRAMRDYPILTTFNVQDGNFNSSAFREFIHSALADGAIKYILTQIKSDDQSTPVHSKYSNVYEMVVGSRYNATLSLQDAPTIGATAIWLSPREAKKGETRLHLFYSRNTDETRS